MAQQAIRSRFGVYRDDERARVEAAYRAELVQVAAVAIAAIEALDRGAWRQEASDE